MTCFVSNSLLLHLQHAEADKEFMYIAAICPLLVLAAFVIDAAGNNEEQQAFRCTGESAL
jgi:hypothetical protein